MDVIDVQVDIFVGLDQRKLFDIPRLRIKSWGVHWLGSDYLFSSGSADLPKSYHKGAKVYHTCASPRFRSTYWNHSLLFISGKGIQAKP